MSGIKIIKRDRYEDLKARERGYFDLEFLKAIPRDSVAQCLDLLDQSHSQLRQDLFALQHLGFKRDGFFVEFGATDGVSLSNSYLMESEFGWTGLLAEPGRAWHDALKANRTATIDTRCIAGRTGDTVSFVELPNGENSGIADYVPLRRKVRGTSYDVETVSLNDFLDQHGAPEVIDYASIDTEGSELSILQGFDFSKHGFRVLTLEHNYRPERSTMYDLLTANGYKRVCETASRFDDWYIHPDL